MSKDEALAKGFAAFEKGLGSCSYEADVERGFHYRFRAELENQMRKHPRWLERTEKTILGRAEKIGEKAAELSGGRPVTTAILNEATYLVGQESPTVLCGARG